MIDTFGIYVYNCLYLFYMYHIKPQYSICCYKFLLSLLYTSNQRKCSESPCRFKLT